jgi:hypothetical protein
MTTISVELTPSEARALCGSAAFLLEHIDRAWLPQPTEPTNLDLAHLQIAVALAAAGEEA